MFRALLAYSQEVLHKRHLVYCVRVMSVGCHRDWSGTGVLYILMIPRTKQPKRIRSFAAFNTNMTRQSVNL
jgi:hypothetical protein